MDNIKVDTTVRIGLSNLRIASNGEFLSALRIINQRKRGVP